MKRVCFTFLTCVFSLTALAEDKQSIGMILPLTGAISSVGEAIRDSALLADELYDTDNIVEFIFEDSAYDARKAVSAYQRLAAREDIAAVVTLGSGPGHAIAPLAEKFKLPTIVIATDPKIFQERKYVVKHWL